MQKRLLLDVISGMQKQDVHPKGELFQNLRIHLVGRAKPWRMGSLSNAVSFNFDNF